MHYTSWLILLLVIHISWWFAVLAVCHITRVRCAHNVPIGRLFILWNTISFHLSFVELLCTVLLLIYYISGYIPERLLIILLKHLVVSLLYCSSWMLLYARRFILVYRIRSILLAYSWNTMLVKNSIYSLIALSCAWHTRTKIYPVVWITWIC